MLVIRAVHAVCTTGSKALAKLAKHPFVQNILHKHLLYNIIIKPIPPPLHDQEVILIQFNLCHLVPFQAESWVERRREQEEPEELEKKAVENKKSEISADWRGPQQEVCEISERRIQLTFVTYQLNTLRTINSNVLVGWISSKSHSTRLRNKNRPVEMLVSFSTPILHTIIVWAGKLLQIVRLSAGLSPGWGFQLPDSVQTSL